MKTLDEVIKFVAERQEHFEENGCFDCHYCGDDCVSGCVIEDALHYLKEYRDYIPKIEKKYHDAVTELSNMKDEDWKDKNLPLAWDELKTMEGKPVWIEVYDPIDEMTGWHTASWKLIEFINDDYFDVRDSDGEQECFYKSESEYWQAYRKERE